VPGDAAATASNILASEALFRIGLAGELLTCLCDIALAAILYVLFRPVSRTSRCWPRSIAWRSWASMPSRSFSWSQPW
jgi:Domain of unknown function (DUF4386)